ncbi:MAG: AAA family ATPase [Flavobacteriaceae bacterium]|nr:AAA family ATPase [Flavobacteriaceae bacterium]
MDLLDKNGYNLRELGNINIVLGKNGCGKSTLLKEVEKSLEAEEGLTKYITPERGGHLKHDPKLEVSFISQNQDWISNQFRKNQYSQFKQQSVLQYRKLETATLREIEKTPVLRNDLDYTFDTVVTKINDLLSNIEIKRSDNDFKVYKKGTEEEITVEQISSGESELISLAIECLYFSKQVSNSGINILFFDEPDVHLHPDLQVKLAKFIAELVNDTDFKVILATHSTALLGGFFNEHDAKFCFMEQNQKDLTFESLGEVYKRILPIFGAHPLSNLFNESPILLLEGEDDVRIWQQAIRSSNGDLKVFPCAVDTINKLNQYEIEVGKIVKSVYDDARGFSLRDRDDNPEDIDDKESVIRMRLSCRAAENLILSDEVLNILDTNWPELETRLNTWIESNEAHSKYVDMVAFRDSEFNRKGFDLKEIRNILIGQSNSNKPWEIAVGQAIGQLKSGSIPQNFSENKLCNFLGRKTINTLVN